MTTKQQPWLISFEFHTMIRVAERGGSARIDRHGPAQEIMVFDCPPWRYLLETKTKLSRFMDGLEDRADDVSAIFWAVQLPVGELTEEEIDKLS